jgi:hypothetical protein
VKFFLSDDADAFFTAWTHTYPPSVAKKTLCTWHVLKNVYAGINQRAKGDPAACQKMKAAFRNVMYAGSQNQCELELSELRKVVGPYPAVADYLENIYLGQRNGLARLEQWALCYRIGSLMSTSAFIESFHR